MWRQHQSILRVASLPRVPEHYVTRVGAGMVHSSSLRTHTCLSITTDEEIDLGGR